MSYPRQDRALGLPRVEVRGKRYTRYDPNIALDIVERVANGELLKDICHREAVPLTVTKATFLKWVATVPDLAKAYAAAQTLSAHSFEEEAISVAKGVAKEPGSSQNVAAKSLLVSQYRWSAARRNPGKYSDKGTVVTVVPVTINTTLDMGKAQDGPVVDIPDIYTLSLPLPQSESEPLDPITDAEYIELPQPLPQPQKGPLHALDNSPLSNSSPEPGPESEAKTEAKSLLRTLIDTSTPVVGRSHQPLFRADDPRFGPRSEPRKPRKRVLIPGQRGPRWTGPKLQKLKKDPPHGS